MGIIIGINFFNLIMSLLFLTHFCKYIDFSKESLKLKCVSNQTHPVVFKYATVSGTFNSVNERQYEQSSVDNPLIGGIWVRAGH
jgi:hypothetical protein